MVFILQLMRFCFLLKTEKEREKENSVCIKHESRFGWEQKRNNVKAIRSNPEISNDTFRYSFVFHQWKQTRPEIWCKNVRVCICSSIKRFCICLCIILTYQFLNWWFRSGRNPNQKTISALPLSPPMQHHTPTPHTPHRFVSRIEFLFLYFELNHSFR